MAAPAKAQLKIGTGFCTPLTAGFSVASKTHQRPFVGQCGASEARESVSTAPAIGAGRLNTPAAAEGRARGPLRAVVLPQQLGQLGRSSRHPPRLFLVNLLVAELRLRLEVLVERLSTLMPPAHRAGPWPLSDRAYRSLR
jgi:hypothetical protein